MPFVNIRIYEGCGKDKGRDRPARDRGDQRRDEAAQGSGLGGLRGGRPPRLVRRWKPGERWRSELRVSIRDPRFRRSWATGSSSSGSRRGASSPKGRSGTRPVGTCCSATCRATTCAGGRQRGRHDVPQAVQQVERPHLGSPGPAARLRARVERVTRTEPDGAIVPLATHYQGKELNSPNDIVVRGGRRDLLLRPDRTVAPSSTACRAAGARLPGRLPCRAGPKSPRCSPTTSTGPTGSASRSTAAPLRQRHRPPAHPRVRRDGDGDVGGGGLGRTDGRGPARPTA